ncbi:MAG: hypothetical protein U5P41_15025 [Gammaproteobacteria bacterium]|nr:hypothetical protein [Gammaproteobacteria bacterium]
MNTQANGIKGFYLGLVFSLAALPAIAPVKVNAEISGANMIDYVSIPVTSTTGATPQVMLAMAKDHSYWFKAYNDYTDLDGDGVVETTYNDDFEYYGYFDPTKCYDYEQQGFSGAGQVQLFVPKAFMTDPDTNHYCDDVAGEWSGNFLNWASMTRMDIVRRILFGGKRLEDQSDFTIIQRAFLPTDAHSFAKFYPNEANDIQKLTPFSGISSGNSQNDGLTICNTTIGNNSSKSDTMNLQNHPPLMRIAKGNYALWAANERWQCYWSDEKSASNSNQSADSGLNAHSSNPDDDNDGLDISGSLGPDYNV